MGKGVSKMAQKIPTSFMDGPFESSPGHTGLGKRGPPVVFGSYKGQMLQNNDQKSQGLTRRFDFVCKKDNTPVSKYTF